MARSSKPIIIEAVAAHILQETTVNLLAASIAALALGPLTYRLARRGNAMIAILDGFVFAAIGGIVFVSVLPETMTRGGWATAVFVALGFAGPTAVERLFKRAAKHAHVTALALSLVGLSLHALLDGATLAGGTAGEQLPAAVVVHRFPVGLAIWWLLRPHFGRLVATLVLGLVAAATAGGYAVGPPLVASISSQEPKQSTISISTRTWSCPRCSVGDSKRLEPMRGSRAISASYCGFQNR